MQGVPWPPAWLEILRRKRAQGLSCSTIAKQMNEELHTSFTRNSIIGKLARHGIPAPGKLATMQSMLQLGHRRKRNKAMTDTPPPPPPTSTLPAPPPAHVLVTSPPPPTAPTPTPSPVPSTMPAPTPALLLDLPDNACRWPVNDATSWQESHLFCGRPVTRMRPPYCEKHYAMGVTRVRLRDLAAD